MKKFWIYVLAILCFGFGVYSGKLMREQEDWYLILFFLLSYTVLLTVPAFKYWLNYFENLFNND